MEFFQIVDSESGLRADVFISLGELLLVSAVAIAGSIAVQMLPDFYTRGKRRALRLVSHAAAPVATTNLSESSSNINSLAESRTQPDRRVGVKQAELNDKDLQTAPRSDTKAEERKQLSDSAAVARSTTEASKPAVAATSGPSMAEPSAQELDKAIDEFLAAEELLDEAITDVVVTSSSTSSNSKEAASASQQPAAPQVVAHRHASETQSKKKEEDVQTNPNSAAAATCSKPAVAPSAVAPTAAKTPSEKELAQKMLRGLSSPASQSTAGAGQKKQPEVAPQSKAPTTQKIKSEAFVDKVGGKEVNDSLLDDALDVVSPTNARAATTSSPASLKKKEVQDQPPKVAPPRVTNETHDSLLDDALDVVSPTKSAPAAATPLPPAQIKASSPATRDAELAMPIKEEARPSTRAPDVSAAPAQAGGASKHHDDLLDDVFDAVDEQHKCISDAILDALVKS